MRRSVVAWLVATLTVATLGVVASPGAGATPAYAPLDRPGPALSVPAAILKAALTCSGDFTHTSVEPVLLNPATAVTPVQNYSWNYERAFTAQGRPWCALTMPFHTLGDIQTAGEYLVYAIRTEHAMAHRRIAILGHSQGGMSMRWALRFWPDTRPMVDDVIGMAPDNHGTVLVGPACQPGRTTCVAAQWQQSDQAAFIAALNSGSETFAGISYTEIFSNTDEVVVPHSSSALRAGPGQVTTVATQQICPLDAYEHLLIGTVDPVTYALVMDALTHSGPAVPSRVSRLVCLQAYQPGVDPLNAQNYIQMLSALPNLLFVPVPFANLVGAPELAAEPALKCYVFAAGCP